MTIMADQESKDSPLPATLKNDVHRRLKSRHIQLIGIGGTIGTALFVRPLPPIKYEKGKKLTKQVQIGKGLLNGGPASLLLAFCKSPLLDVRV